MTKTVLYFHPKLSSFIKKDLLILEKYYNLKIHEFKPVSTVAIIGRFLNQLIFILKNISSADIIVCRFLGYHSFLPTLLARLLQKPCLSIVGGTECYCYPSINYGSLRKPVYSWFTRMSFLNSTHIAPVHKSLVATEDHFYGKDFLKQGYSNFFPDVKTPYTEIYNGFDEQSFYPVPGIKRIPNSFITVASNYFGAEFYIKGIDLVIELAKTFPRYNFTIIGKVDSGFPRLNNLTSIPYVENNELRNHYSSHEFCLQLSRAEGFPNALCEAMLCECIPIGSAIYGIPLIVGNTGFLLEKCDMAMLGDLIGKAVISDKVALAKSARQRIIAEFPLKRREEKLISLLNQLMKYQ